jgi:arylsulfatase A
MKILQKIQPLLATGTGIALLASICVSETEKSLPNVLFIVHIDDMGWSDLTSFGSDFYQSPNIDRLVASGVKFTDNYAACTVCSPTRAAFLTGKYFTPTLHNDILSIKKVM